MDPDPIIFAVCLPSEHLSEVDSDQNSSLQEGYLADISDESSDSRLSLAPDLTTLPKLPTACTKPLERGEPSSVPRPTRFASSPLPELRRASDGDDENEEESCQRKKNRLARRIRLQQYLVNGPALANMPFDEGYHLRNKLSGESLSSKTRETPRHRLLRIRNKTIKKKWPVQEDDYLDNPDLMLNLLVQIFLEQIQKVIRDNSKTFCNLMKTKNRDPGRLVMLLTSEQWGLTIGDILTKLFETISREQDESLVSSIASHLFNNDLFKLRKVLSKIRMCWMLRGSRYRQWIKSLSSSSSDE